MLGTVTRNEKRDIGGKGCLKMRMSGKIGTQYSSSMLPPFECSSAFYSFLPLYYKAIISNYTRKGFTKRSHSHKFFEDWRKTL